MVPSYMINVKPRGDDPVTCFHFDRFHFHDETGELTAKGEVHRLRPKTAALLAWLIAHRDEVVDKETLFANVWGDAVVSDATLVQSIQELRKALGDDAREPRFIKTYPKRGYRFIATVTETAPKPPAKRRRWLKPAAVGACLFLLLELFLEFVPSESPPPVRLLVPPLVNEMTDDELAWMETGFQPIFVDALKRDLRIEVVSDLAYYRATREAGDEPLQLLEATDASYLLTSRLHREEEARVLTFQLVGETGRLLALSYPADSPSTTLSAWVEEVVRILGEPGEPGLPKAIGEADAAYARALHLLRAQGPRAARPLFEAVLAIDPGHGRARRDLGWASYRMGDWQAAEKCFDELLETAEITGNNRSLAVVLRDLSAVRAHRGEFAEAEELLHRAHNHARFARDTAHEVRILRSLGHMRLIRGHALERDRYYARARKRAAWVNDPVLEAEELYHMGAADDLGDGSPDNHKLLHLALEAFEELGMTERLYRVRVELAKHQLTPYEDRVDYLRETIAASAKRGHLTAQLDCLEILIWTELLGSQLDETPSLIEEAMELADSIGARFSSAQNRYALGIHHLIAARRGPLERRDAEIRRAVSMLEEALRRFEELAVPDRAAAVCLLLGVTYLEEGDLERTESYLIRADEVLRDYDIPEASFMTMICLATLSMKRDDHQQALAYLEPALTLFPRLNPLAQLLQARCHYMLGNYAQAHVISRARKQQMQEQWREEDERVFEIIRRADELGEVEPLPPLPDLMLTYLRMR